MAISKTEIIIGANLRQFERSMNRFERRFARQIFGIARKAERMGRALEGVGRRLTSALTVPLAGAGFVATRTALSFDEAMTKIITLVGVSQKQVNAWRKDLLKLAPLVGKTPQELAEGLFFVTSAGIETSKALEVLKISAQASALGMGDVATVADIVTGAMNAYESSNLDAATAAAVLFKTIKLGKADADQLADSIGQVIGIAAAAGVSFRDIGAAISVLTRVGAGQGNAAEAVVGLKNIINAITKGQADKQLKNIGLSAQFLRDTLMQEGGVLTVLQILSDKFDGNAAAMTEIFPNIRAMGAAFKVLKQDAAKVEAVFAEMAETTGQDLNDAFTVLSASFAFKFKQASAALNSGFLILGNELLPAVIPLIQRITGIVLVLADRFSKLSQKTKEWVLKAGAIALIAGPILLVAGIIISSFGMLTRALGSFLLFSIRAFKFIGKAFAFMALGVVKGIGLLVATFGAAPVAIGLAIAAMIALLFSFNDTAGVIWDQLTTGMATNWKIHWNNIKVTLELRLAQIKNLLIRAGEFIDSIFGTDLSGGELIDTNEIRSRLQELVPIGDFFNLEEIKSAFQKDLNDIKQFFKNMIGGIKDAALALLPDGMKEILFGGEGVDGILEDADELFANVLAKLEEFGANASETFGGIGDEFVKIGDALESSIESAVTSAIVELKSLGDFVKSLGRLIQTELVRRSIAIPIADAIGGVLNDIFPNTAGGGDRSTPFLAGERGIELVQPKGPVTVRNAHDTRNILGFGGGGVRDMEVNANFITPVPAVVREQMFNNAALLGGLLEDQILRSLSGRKTV